MKTTKESSNRIVFLDNLRFLFVLCVVIGHSGNAYFSLTRWWPVSESIGSIAVDWINLFFDAFTMPLLFFIAGYFALPSISKGIVNFLKGKLKRLGIPWIVCILTICPVLPLIYHYTRNGFTLSNSYMEIWLAVMKNFTQFNIGIIDSMNELMLNNQFYQRYMWFISLLLLFFIIFSIVYKLRNKWFNINEGSANENITVPSVSATMKLLIIVGSLSFIFSTIFIVIMLIFGKTSNPSAWLTLGNIIQFRPLRIALFMIYFAMGIIAYKNRWIERNKFPGHLKTWIISFIVFLSAYLYDMNAYLKCSTELKALYGFLSVPLYSFLTISILGLFSSTAIRYWNKPTAINRSLSENSYNIYLSHYIFVLVFQLILLCFPGIPAIVKFVIVSALSVFCAYTVSRFLIRPFPKATIVLLFVMFITMFAVIKP